MVTAILQNLNRLHMSTSSRKKSGLLPVNDGKILEHAPNAVIALLSAQECKADYVYFREFADGRPPLPQVYIYDNTKNRISDKEVAELHRKVWNRGEAPLMYVIGLSSISIFSCARKPDFLKAGKLQCNPAETIELISAAQAELDRFSGKEFDSGMFWANPRNYKLVNKNKAAHQSLVLAIKDFDAKIADKGSLPKKVGRRLLILCILVKYLEDRKVFPEGYFSRFLPDAKCFFNVLQNDKATIGLFEDLEAHFNGDVFTLTDEEKSSLSSEKLQEFSVFIEAKTLKSQLHFWTLYTFEDIPVEIISYIYQNFVKGSDAVYTPHFLVDLLLDESMSLQNLRDDFRVFDPACGSGVFLVGAYKRMVHAWRYRNGWKTPEAETLKKLLKNNIFGVDLDGTAVELTAFSLCLALCDALQPNVIWNELRFDQLKTDNIVEADFFSRKAEANFDLLIGNPPFEEKLTTPAAQQINEEYALQRGSLPQNQISYLFLEHGFKFLAAEGKLCLIIPHGILYNYGTQEFRKHIFSSWHVEEVLDFISVRGLFSSADVKVCTLLIQNRLPDNEMPVTHITFRRNKNTREQLNFEIDHYDVHNIPRDLATEDRLIWRANLLGGARVFSIIQRVSQQRTLKEFVDDKGWEFGEGFIAANKNADKRATWITNKNHLPTGAFNQNGIDESKITVYRGEYFKCPYTESRFTPPMILFKANDSLPVEFWTKCYLTFLDKIISISGGKEHELKKVYDVLKDNHRDYQFFLSLLGSQALTGKATAPLKQDIDNLPYPEKLEQMVLSKTERVIRDDVLDYIQLFIRRGDKSELFQRKPTTDELMKFGDVYCDLLRSIYKSVKPYEPIVMSSLTCFPFYFGSKPEIDLSDSEKLEENLNTLIQRQHHKTLQISRIVRLYEKNVIYLVKPNLLRYWIRSIAIRDADETFVELREQGF
jgi:type I restriction-modification system DNA methylase subunit